MTARITVASTLAALVALVLTTTASASEPLQDGDYSITLPDGSAIAFTISDHGNVVEVGSLPSGFSVSEDESSDGDTTEISDGTVTVEIETGDDGGIEVDGVSFGDSFTVSALIPDAAGAVGITVDGDDVDVTTPPGFEVVDIDTDEDEVEVQISDGDRTFEIELHREDGSIDLELADDDSSSDDSISDDEESADDVSEADEPSDESMLDDSVSDDDDSSDGSLETSTLSKTETTGAPSTEATEDDDDSSDAEDEASEDDDSSD